MKYLFIDSSLVRSLVLSVLVSLLLPFSIAHAANLAKIKSAIWEVGDSKLKVKGKLAPQGTTIVVTDSQSGLVLGTAIADARNIWRLAVKITGDTNVPCSVQATTGDNSDVKQIEDAPADCGSPIVPPVDLPIDPSIENPIDPIDPLVEAGSRLFFEETFSGNGRTCSTCHRAENNFTIDPTFIATLPLDDPLFVAEQNPALTELEDSLLLRQFGLVRANVDGFEDPANKFVMRSVSHMFALGSSIASNATEAPLESTGWSGDGAPGAGTLREFSTGAVVQHFTKSLDRIEGQDFRLPGEEELDALEAFMLSLGGPGGIDLQTLRLTNVAAERGRVLFITEDSENRTKGAAKCNACHTNAGALTVAGINQNFDTGIENKPHAADLIGALRPTDGGFGTQFDGNTNAFGNGTFNPPSLIDAADTAPYFHNNVAATLEDAIAHYESSDFRMSPEGQRLLLADSGGQELTVDVDALAAFLRVINVIENVRSSVDHLTDVKQYRTEEGIQRLLGQSNIDLNDVLKVLAEGGIHDDVVPNINDARAFIASAQAELPGNTTARNDFVDLAIAAAESGRDLMVSTLPVEDTVDPVVAITSPGTGSSVFGLVTVSADATDDVGINTVVFTLDQTEIGQDNTAPFEMVLDSSTFADGAAVLTVTAADLSNNVGSDAIPLVIDNASVTPQPDTVDPVVTILAPVEGSTVSDNVTVSADATDNVDIVNVVFTIDGNVLGQDTTSPYGQNWNTLEFSNGSHSILVTAQDSAGNSAYSSMTVTVDNPTIVCSVYSCPNPPPPPTEPPPVPVTPDGSSPDGEFEGEVINVDLQASTVTVNSGGVIDTVQITTDTEFKGSISLNIAEILVGHIAQGEFFKSTGEAVWIEADLPPGF